jgi:hypothetical protein
MDILNTLNIFKKKWCCRFLAHLTQSYVSYFQHLASIHLYSYYMFSNTTGLILAKLCYKGLTNMSDFEYTNMFCLPNSSYIFNLETFFILYDVCTCPNGVHIIKSFISLNFSQKGCYFCEILHIITKLAIMPILFVCLIQARSFFISQDIWTFSKGVHLIRIFISFKKNCEA